MTPRSVSSSDKAARLAAPRFNDKRYYYDGVGVGGFVMDVALPSATLWKHTFSNHLKKTSIYKMTR